MAAPDTAHQDLWLDARTRVLTAARLGPDEAPAVWSLLRDAVVGLALFARRGDAPYAIDRPDIERAFSDLKGALGSERWPADADVTRRFLDAPPLSETPWAETARALVGARALVTRLGPNPRAARWMTRYLPLLALTLGGLAIGRWAWRSSQNLAVDADVTVSSTTMRARDLSKLVSGEWTPYYAVLTSRDISPWIMLELDEPTHIGSVVVYNRGDGALEDSLPLVLEVESDGGWIPVARRTELFSLAEPWVANDVGRTARRVRLRLDREGSFALARVEIYSDNRFRP